MFNGEILKIIPKIFLLFLLIWSPESNVLLRRPTIISGSHVCYK